MPQESDYRSSISDLLSLRRNTILPQHEVFQATATWNHRTCQNAFPGSIIEIESLKKPEGHGLILPYIVRFLSGMTGGMQEQRQGNSYSREMTPQSPSRVDNLTTLPQTTRYPLKHRIRVSEPALGGMQRLDLNRNGLAREGCRCTPLPKKDIFGRFSRKERPSASCSTVENTSFLHTVFS